MVKSFIAILNQPFMVKEKRWRVLLTVLVIGVMLTFAARGFTMPWTYGYLQYSLTWFHGYLGRGFIGTILSLIFGEVYFTKTFLGTMQILLGVLFFAYLSYIVYKLIYKDGNLFSALILCIFSTSAFCMFYLAEVGFFDHFIYLLVAIFIEIAVASNKRVTIIWGGILSALSVLILQTSAFIVCPVFASITMLKVFYEENGQFRLRSVSSVCSAFIPTVILSGLVSIIQPSQKALDIFLEQSKLRDYYASDFIALSIWSKPNGADLNVMPKGWVYFEPKVVIYIALVIGLMAFFLYCIKTPALILGGYGALAILSAFTGYATIYMGTDFHRYYFCAFMSMFFITVFLLRLYGKHYLTWKQGLLTMLVIAIILPHVILYRIWRWNRVYNDYWFEKMIR